MKTGAVFDDDATVAMIALQDGTRHLLAVGRDAKNTPAMEIKQIIQPFKHPRVIVGDFDAAQALIKYVIKNLDTKRSIFLPVIILHWSEKLDGGMAAIEARALHEMAASCGAAKVYISAENHAYSDEEVKSLKGDFV